MSLESEAKEKTAAMKAALTDSMMLLAAKLVHLSWVSYQMGAGQSYNVEATSAQLASQTNGLSFFLQSPNRAAEENHDNWMKLRLADGWKYGSVKDEGKKEHPDLVPYDELPEVEKMKDTMDLVARRIVIEVINQVFQLGQVTAQNQAVNIVQHFNALVSQGAPLKNVKLVEMIQSAFRHNALEFDADGLTAITSKVKE